MRKKIFAKKHRSNLGFTNQKRKGFFLCLCFFREGQFSLVRHTHPVSIMGFIMHGSSLKQFLKEHHKESFLGCLLAIEWATRGLVHNSHDTYPVTGNQQDILMLECPPRQSPFYSVRYLGSPIQRAQNQILTLQSCLRVSLKCALHRWPTFLPLQWGLYCKAPFVPPSRPRTALNPSSQLLPLLLMPCWTSVSSHRTIYARGIPRLKSHRSTVKGKEQGEWKGGE